MHLRPGASAMLRGGCGGSGASPLAMARLSTCSDCFRRAATSLDVRIPLFNGATTAGHRALYHSSGRRSSAFAAALQVATNVVSGAISRAATKAGAGAADVASIDPLRIVASEMKFLTGNIRKLLGSGHPSLDRVAKYYTQAEGKHVRPLIVLLMARATALCPKTQDATPSLPEQAGADAIDASLSPLPILADHNPSLAPQPDTTTTTSTPTQPLSSDATTPPPALEPTPPPSAYTSTTADILPSQRRLAEIAELIHTASLLHDDVIDHSVSRRGAPSANLQFGNKMAVLGGDFLLGRASVALARLRNAEVVELLATVIANLVEGEFMQLKNTARDERNPAWSEDALAYYLQKTYLKTASLISKSCRAAALLGGADQQTVEAAYLYGKNLGLAFQLVDDLLDYTVSGKDLGKPAGADLELGLATAPLLFAWKNIPELGSLVGRKFEQEGDVERARELVLQSDGIEQTRALATGYSESAIAAIDAFPDSEAKDGLIEMAVKTLKRQK